MLYHDLTVGVGYEHFVWDSGTAVVRMSSCLLHSVREIHMGGSGLPQVK